MDRQQCFHDLELNHNQILHYHVHPIAAIKLDSFVDDWQRNLPLDPKLLLNSFVDYALFVCRFKQTWTQDAVNLDSTADYRLG